MVKGKNKTVVYWLAKLKNSEHNPTLSNEHTEFKWLDKDAAIKLSGFSDFEAMVQHFHDQIPNL